MKYINCTELVESKSVYQIQYRKFILHDYSPVKLKKYVNTVQWVFLLTCLFYVKTNTKHTQFRHNT